jgi:hypothetical protein
MNVSEFKKLIKYESLGNYEGFEKFMYKAYLNCKLANGKWKPCFLYGIGRKGKKGLTLECIAEDTPLPTWTGKDGGSLEVLFKQIVKQGYFIETKHTWEQLDAIGLQIKFYDENGVKIAKPAKSVTEVESIIKTTYFLSKPVTIVPYK